MAAAPRKPKKEKKTALLLRLDPPEAKQLDELARRLPWASRTSLALVAIRVGLAEIERDPSRLMESK